MKLSEFIEKYGDREVTEEMKKFIKPKFRKWIPEKGEAYCTIDGYGNASEWSRSDLTCEEFYKLIPCFKTKEECQDYIDIHKDFEDKSFIPNLNNCEEQFYQFFYEKICGKVKYSIYSSIIYGKYVFKSGKICKELLDKWGSDKIAKYILEIDL